MDKKSKIFFVIFGLLIVGSVAFTFYKIMIKKDYVIEGQTDCDPTVEKCFIWECDPASSVEGEKCTGDADKDTWYYQIARRNTSRIPLCDPDKDENCDRWTCEPGEKDCSITFCDDQTKTEQKVECSDPVQYNIDNPPVDESENCAEGDETCANQDSNGGVDDAQNTDQGE